MMVHSGRYLAAAPPRVKSATCLTEVFPSSKTRAMPARRLQKVLTVSIFAVLSLALGGASCDKKSVERMVTLGATDEQVTDLYGRRYGEHENYSFSLRDTPFVGAPNAPVVLVEFFDYACPHCREAAPILEDVVAQRSKDAVL